MRTLLQRALTLFALVTLVVTLYPQAAQAVISWIPPITNHYDLGSTAKLFRSTFLSNLTIANSTIANSTVNVTGQLTSNAIVSNSTINSTGLLTADNATVNGTVTTVDVVASGVINSTGVATLDNVTCNGTVTTVNLAASALVNGTGTATLGNVVTGGALNVTGLSTVSNLTASGSVNVTGNSTVTGSLYGRLPTGATLSSANLTLTSANVGVVWLSGIGGNRTCTIGTAASVGEGGWYEFRSVGNVSVNGNVTVNVTSTGNVNGVDAYLISAAPYQVTRLVSNGSAYTATSSVP